MLYLSGGRPVDRTRAGAGHFAILAVPWTSVRAGWTFGLEGGLFHWWALAAFVFSIPSACGSPLSGIAFFTFSSMYIRMLRLMTRCGGNVRCGATLWAAAATTN